VIKTRIQPVKVKVEVEVEVLKTIKPIKEKAVHEKKINTILQKNTGPRHVSQDKPAVINTNISTLVQSNDVIVGAIIVIKIISAIAQ
jgi:hypothetical protein